MPPNKWLYLLQVSLWIFTERMKDGVILAQGTRTETCGNESYRARCGSGQAIVMTTANFGILHVGRCIRTKYLNATCSANVLPNVDKLCSGLSNCSFYAGELHNEAPCPVDLMRHLETSYTCMAVHECMACQNGQEITLHETSGTISNVVRPGTSSCTSGPCTWILPSKSGQTFNFTLYDFSSLPKRSIGNSNIRFLPKGSGCHPVALIKRRFSAAEGDHQQGGDLPQLCQDGVREKSFQVAGGGSLQVTWMTPAQVKDDERFLLKYELFGCPDIEIPLGTTSQRSEDGSTLTIRCVSVVQTWHLICGGSAWVGEIGTCKSDTFYGALYTICNPKNQLLWTEGSRQGDRIPGVAKSPQSDDTSPSGLGTLIVIGIGLGIGVVFGLCMLVLVMVYMKRRRRRPYEYPTMTSPAQHHHSNQGDYFPYMEKPMLVQDTDYQCTHARPHQQQSKCPHTRPDLKSFRPIPEGDAMDDIYSERTGTGKSNLSNALVIDDTTALKPRMYEKPCQEMEAKMARLKNMQQSFQ